MWLLWEIWHKICEVKHHSHWFLNYLQHLKQQQEGLSHLISIIKDDLEDIKLIEHELNESIPMRGGFFSWWAGFCWAHMECYSSLSFTFQGQNWWGKIKCASFRSNGVLAVIFFRICKASSKLLNLTFGRFIFCKAVYALKKRKKTESVQILFYYKNNMYYCTFFFSLITAELS